MILSKKCGVSLILSLNKGSEIDQPSDEMQQVCQKCNKGKKKNVIYRANCTPVFPDDTKSHYDPGFAVP